jgi:hypothetical protein
MNSEADITLMYNFYSLYKNKKVNYSFYGRDYS